MQLDLKNCFGMLDRPAAIQALERDGGALAQLADFVRVVYGNILILSGSMVPDGDDEDSVNKAEMARGVVQGDPIAPAVFAFSIKAALNAALEAGTSTSKSGFVPAWMTAALLGHLGHQPEFVLAVYKALTEALSASGGALNHGKRRCLRPARARGSGRAGSGGACKVSGGRRPESVEDHRAVGLSSGPRPGSAERARRDTAGPLTREAELLVRLADRDSGFIQMALSRALCRQGRLRLCGCRPPKSNWRKAFDILQRQVAIACFRVAARQRP